MRLTGKIRYRSGFRGTLVLQVEYLEDIWTYPDVIRTVKSWRDARTADLLEVCPCK